MQCPMKTGKAPAAKVGTGTESLGFAPQLDFVQSDPGSLKRAAGKAGFGRDSWLRLLSSNVGEELPEAFRGQSGVFCRSGAAGDRAKGGSWARA